MRTQGLNSMGEEMSSAYVQKDDTDPAIVVDCSDLPSLTRQEFAEDCDINSLMSKYEKTGIISHINPAAPQYLDLYDMPDLQQAFDAIQNANQAFMSLPASVRREFDNDPVKFVAYAEDPANLEKLREWKLAPPAATEPPPTKVEVINPAPPKDEAKPA